METDEKKTDKKLDTFKDKKDKISIQRKSISERCENFAKHEVGACKLIVPTGGGKTLSSLRFAISYCEKFDMDKIIYVAPFMSILEQNSEVIQEIAGEYSFLEHHSNILQEIDEYEELKEYELHSEKWDKPIIATTMVQFLNALFKGKSSSVRRMHRLSKSVIIIDEIQSLPLKCVNMFNLAVNFLTHICGSVVVLCSATQPVLNATAYPVILDKNSSMTGDYSEDFKIFQRTQVVSAITNSGYTYQSAAEFCYKKYLENKNLLIVVNTKKAASEIYQRIKSMNELTGDDKAIIKHLSTNMCPQHRKMVIDDIRRLLNDHKKVICITTQLIEAGVDISFNCVVRSLAGMDNSAQAAGRCNRNGEIDGICPVYIINITDENLGTMQEVKTAQNISRLIIGSNKFDDLLDTEAMSIYFQKLYAEEKSELSYNVKDGGCDTNLVNLLSVNKIRYDMKQKKSVQYAAQAFKTTGNLFKVIDNNTFDVIVPFDDEAKHMIERLQSEPNHYETTELLRKAQKYTINVYEQAIRELDSIGALNIDNNGIYSLNEGYYDNEIGLNYDKNKKQVLMM